MIVLSTFVRTICHNAPVFQVLESDLTLVCPVRCAACGAESGAPGLEDLPEESRAELSLARLRGGLAAAVREFRRG